MSERYTKLFSLENNLYSSNTPILICAGVLTKDNDKNKVLVQLRLQNIDSKYRKITAVKVAVSSYDPAGSKLGAEKIYHYLDLDVNRGAEFGGKVPIYLDDNSARSFSVYFQEVVFADGQVWTGENENWTSLKQKTLEETFDPDLVEQYKRDTFSGAMYEPLINSDVWMCTCGTLNLAGDKNCCKCHNNREELLSALDQNTLADHLAAYTEKTTSESKEKRVKNIKKQVVSIVALVLILIAGFKSFKNGQEKATENAVVRALIGTSWDDGHYIFSDEHTITQKMRSWYVEGKYDTETRRWDVTELNGNVMRICITRYTEKYYYDVFFKKENGIVEIKSIKPLHSDGSGYGWSLIQDY